MPKDFVITPEKSVANLDAAGQGKVDFAVSNLSGNALRGTVRIVPLQGAEPEWFSLIGAAERDYPPTGMQQYTVRVSVPPQTPAGPMSFRLDAAATDASAEPPAEGPPVQLTRTAPARPEPIRTAPMPVAPTPPKKEEKKTFPIAVAAAIALVALLCVIGLGIALHKSPPPPPPTPTPTVTPIPVTTIPMPDVTTLHASDARTVLIKLGLKKIREIPEVTGSVITRDSIVGSTSPAANTPVDPQTLITLNVTGSVPTPVVHLMPNVIGMRVSEANEALLGLHIEFSTRQQVDNTVESKSKEPVVIRSAPEAGQNVNPGTQIVLTIPGGAPPLLMPDLRGSLFTEIHKKLMDAQISNPWKAEQKPTFPPSLYYRVDGSVPKPGEPVAPNQSLLFHLVPTPH